jgi:hypothetical protein
MINIPRTPTPRAGLPAKASTHPPGPRNAQRETTFATSHTDETTRKLGVPIKVGRPGRTFFPASPLEVRRRSFCPPSAQAVASKDSRRLDREAGRPVQSDPSAKASPAVETRLPNNVGGPIDLTPLKSSSLPIVAGAGAINPARLPLDDLIAEAKAALAKFDAHGRDSIPLMLKLGEALCKVKEGLPHGEWGPWCKDGLGRSLSWVSAHRRLFEARDKLNAALTWADATRHRFAHCRSVECLLKVIADWERTVRGDAAAAPKAKQTRRDAIAELKDTGRPPIGGPI